MKSMVSVRGQTVVPAGVRHALGIKSHEQLFWEVRDGVAIVRPLPADPVRASIGIAKGMGTYHQFINERTAERRREGRLEESATS
ncbi:MAG: AbrB/MazE/SpoVT family DNA-binding domain-containing protein [Chloroflexota bacterium]|nr:AbrB/MazE/SpoVT family DNA-binding domain-containing protein [Chloroflexota bacterium]